MLFCIAHVMSYSSSLKFWQLLIAWHDTERQHCLTPQPPCPNPGLSCPSGGSTAHDCGWAGLGLVIASACDIDEQTAALCFTKCPQWAASSGEHPTVSCPEGGDTEAWQYTCILTTTNIHRHIVHVHTHTHTHTHTHSQSRHFPVQTSLFILFSNQTGTYSQSVSLLRPAELCVFSEKASTHWSLLGVTLAFIWWDDGCSVVGCCCLMKTSLTL